MADTGIVQPQVTPFTVTTHPTEDGHIIVQLHLVTGLVVLVVSKADLKGLGETFVREAGAPSLIVPQVNADRILDDIQRNNGQQEGG